MQFITSRSAGGAAVLALVLAWSSAAAQTGLSVSNATVVDYSNLGNNTNSCGQFSTTPSSVTSEATSAIANCGPVLGGSASAMSNSTNATRSASAFGSSTQSGTQGQTDAVGHGWSTQYSQLTVTGTPSVGDNLVFHFVTSQSATGSFNSNSGFGFWNLTLAGGTNNPVFAQQTAGTAMILGSGAAQTAQGFDFTMPFTPNGSLFLYNFTVDAYGYITGVATGNVTQTGSLSATLGGIDWVNGSGAVVGSATFAQNGFATLGAGPVGPPSTVPEPSSTALLGTGVVALIPMVRRRRTR